MNLPLSYQGISRFIVKAILLVGLAVGAIIMMIPFLWMLSTAFKDLGQAFSYPIRWIPEPPTLQNFRDIFTNLNFARYTFNSFYVALATTILEVLTASLAAFAFARMRWRGRDAVFLIYLSSLMIPGDVTVIPKFIMMSYAGLVDTYSGLILPNAFTAFGTFLLRQYFLGLPQELDEAAKIDGASWFQIWRNVVMPLSTPALATVFIFSFMSSWNSFFWPLVMISSDDLRTLPIAIRWLASERSSQWTQLMAASFIALLPVLILYFSAQKYFVRGISMTGMGGR